MIYVVVLVVFIFWVASIMIAFNMGKLCGVGEFSNRNLELVLQEMADQPDEMVDIRIEKRIRERGAGR